MHVKGFFCLRMGKWLCLVVAQSDGYSSREKGLHNVNYFI